VTSYLSKQFTDQMKRASRDAKRILAGSPEEQTNVNP
jgi:hypothetical protein